MAEKEEVSIKLQIVCQNAPYQLGEFGLQDKDKVLHPPIIQDGALWRFELLVRVAKNTKTGAPNFLGDFTHGTSEERFLYVSLREKGGAKDSWIRRIKIPLKSISWEQIVSQEKLSIEVDGSKAATVKDARWESGKL